MGRKKLCFQCDIPTPNPTLLLCFDLLLLVLQPPAAKLTLLEGMGGGDLRGLNPKGRKSSVTWLQLTEKYKNNPFSRCVVLNNFVFAYRQVFVEYYERARPSSS